MKKTFEKPDFINEILEFRFDNNEVCIYGSAKGLKWLAEKCLLLSNEKQINHVHLSDYQILTKNSLEATLALFQTPK